MTKKYELPYTLKLSEPVKIGNDEPITSITISRKPKAKDLEGIPNDTPDFDRSAKMISRLTGQLPTVISELDLADFMALDDVVASFLPDSRRIGAN